LSKVTVGKLSSALGKSLADSAASDNNKKIREIRKTNIKPQETVQLDRYTYRKKLIVPDSAVRSNSKLAVKLSVKDQNSSIMTTRNFTLDHTEGISHGMLPRVRPFIDASINKESLLRDITCIQKDPNADGIVLYTRPVDLRKRHFSPFEKMGQFNLKMSELYMTESANDLDTSVIVRAIPVNRGENSGKFADTVTKGIRDSEDSVLQKTSEASLFASSSQQGVNVTIYNIRGSDFSEIVLARRQIVKGPVPPRNKFEILDIKLSDDRFLDTDVLEYEMYEYKCGFVKSNGLVELSYDSAVVEYFKPINILSASAIVTRSDVSSNKIVNTFNLSAQVLQDTTPDLLRKGLEDLGIADLYDRELTSIRSSMSNLVFFSVSRKDLVSGQLVCLGYHNSGEFSDTIQRSNRSFGRPQYLYIFEAFVRSASRLISEVSSKTRKASSQSSQMYLEQSSNSHSNITIDHSLKFTSETVSRSGTLSYGDAFENNHPEGSIGLGKTGIVKYFEYTGTYEPPSVRRVSVKRTLGGDSIITWSIAGSESHIDHFIIYSSMAGITKLVGTSCHVATHGKYRFIDITSRRALGTISYKIVPILLDYTQGKSGSGKAKVRI
tara:strand:+ start:18560 stop:20383 length:1824 start_codon:yes stop_codon:yes gene_type:complete